MRRALLASAALLACSLGTATAHANPLDAFGMGSRSAGMGSAVAADVSDFSANYYNPAGLALAHGFEFTVGYMRADHSLSMNGKDSGVDPVRGLVAGAVVPGKLFGIPFSVGVGLHMPDEWLARVRALAQDQPRWELYDNRNQRIWFGVNLAVSPTPWLQLGGGITLMAATIANLDISGDFDLLKPYRSSLRHQVTSDLTMVAYPDFGARVELAKWLALALVYRGQFQMDLNVGAQVSAGAATGSAVPMGSNPSLAQTDLTNVGLGLQTNTIDSFLPQQVVLGSSWRLTDDLKANLDVTWVNWSAYIPPVTQISTQLNIPPPKGGWPAGIQPPTQPAPIIILPIQMSDTVVPHVGVEWRAVKQESWQGFVRGGYEYDKSPIGPQAGQTNYVDSDRHAFSAGLGVRLIHPGAILPGDVRFDVHGQYSYLPTVTISKADAADLVGNYTAGGHIWAFGANATVGF